MINKKWLLLGLTLGLVLVQSMAQTTLWITIEAGKTADELPGPYFLPSPPQMKAFRYFRLVDGGTNQSIWGQRWNADSLVFVLNRPLAAGKKRTYVMEGLKERPGGGIRFVQQDGRLQVSAGDRRMFSYHTAVAEPPQGLPAYYRRSGFIHPLYSPAGAVLSDDFPVGHAHQHGLFFTWVNTTFRGEPTDFWNQQNQTGTVEHVAVLDTLSGPVYGRLRLGLRHRSLRQGPALEEVWTLTIWNLPQPFLIDFESEQWCATKDTLFLNQYHYGGMAFRGRADWNPADSTRFRDSMQVQTREGLARAQSNHSRPGWIAAWGKAGEEKAGIIIFDHPTNFRYPQHVRVHPEMPYFCFTPVVEQAFMLTPGDRYRSRYRLLLFDGEPDLAKLATYGRW